MTMHQENLSQLWEKNAMFLWYSSSRSTQQVIHKSYTTTTYPRLQSVSLNRDGRCESVCRERFQRKRDWKERVALKEGEANSSWFLSLLHESLYFTKSCEDHLENEIRQRLRECMMMVVQNRIQKWIQQVLFKKSCSRSRLEYESSSRARQQWEGDWVQDRLLHTSLF